MGISLTHLTMASQIKQDMPPSGGYKPIRYARRLPARPISAGAMFGITAAITVAGFAMVAKGNAARRNEEDEKIRARMALVPLLQAEEAELMAGVEGWDTDIASVYHTRDWVPPAGASP